MSKKIIYIMGAGRSGTTALATFLGNSEAIVNAGELHQFFDHVAKGENCSCNTKLSQCRFWSKVLKTIPNLSVKKAKSIETHNHFLEFHNSIFKHIFKRVNKDDLEEYIFWQERLFKGINRVSAKSIIIDSSKYIGRALALRNIKGFDCKVIYMVRDVRGVIHSFSKKVQTRKNPGQAIIYYSIINCLGLLVYLLFPKDKIIKIKYEDLLEDPVNTLLKIGEFVEVDLKKVIGMIEKSESFSMGHIIGGNRIKENEKIYFKKDITWRLNMPKTKQIWYYFLTWPLMLINRYSI